MNPNCYNPCYVELPPRLWRSTRQEKQARRCCNSSSGSWKKFEQSLQLGKHDFILLQPGQILPVKGQRNKEYRVFLTFFLSSLLAASKQARPFLFFSFLAWKRRRRRSIKEVDGDEIRVHENNTHLMERRVGWSSRVFLLAASKQAGAVFFFFSLFEGGGKEGGRGGAIDQES